MMSENWPEGTHYVEAANLPKAFFDNVEQGGDRKLLFEKRDGDWHGRSWREISDDVRRLAAVLVECGVEPGERVLISAENRPEWAIADLAIMAVGAIVVPAYTTNTEDDHHYIMDHSGASVAITSGGMLASRIALAANRAPSLRHLIVMDDGFVAPQDLRPELRYWGAAIEGADPLVDIDDRLAAQQPDDVCCFIYTSGTGGRPKGVMLTHRSIQANITAAVELLAEGKVVENQRFLSLLPLSHSYEHTAGMHLPFQILGEVWYCESTDQIANNLIEVSPTLMTAVPRLYEVLHDRIMRGVRAKGGVSEKLFMAAVRLGTKRLSGRHLLPHEFLLNLIVDRLVRTKVRARLGGQLKYFISGGAALNPEIGNFFMALGINLLQGYGQTEASPLISANRPGRIKIETVGPVVAGVDLRMADDGEILVRGDLLMKGYWRDEAATAGAIRDGWLHTGDLGEIDADGYISITGRKKDIIVNSGGDNIAPGRVEALLTIEPEIEQAMVDGDRRPWLSAVIVPSDELRNIATSPDALYTMVSEAVDRANSRLSQLERVRRFIIADEPFGTENGQMTATLKVRRHVVREIYGDRIQALYPQK
ncbi:MAG: long-chain fatty acid--CoA ligase [Pseudomonadota bacterium]|nr:long-chain fatty acid--CoA ligase [Pseudomonadota bacterium]